MKTYKVGSIFHHRGTNVYYILGRVEFGVYTLISLSDGNRWGDTFHSTCDGGDCIDGDVVDKVLNGLVYFSNKLNAEIKEPDWKDTLSEKNILCWVTNDDDSEWIAGIVEEYSKGFFYVRGGKKYVYARPFREDEVEDYIWTR